jgi:hypothetical protein
VSVAVAEGDTEIWVKRAELDVKLDDPGALVIAKPAGAVIRTDPSICVDASFVTAKEKVLLAPGAVLDGDTATAKHLPEAMQVLEVAPAQGAVSIAAPSMPVASTPTDIRAMLKPGFRMANPFNGVNRRPWPASADRARLASPSGLAENGGVPRSCDQAALPPNVRSQYRPAQGQKSGSAMSVSACRG